MVNNAITRTIIAVGQKNFEIKNKYYQGDHEIKIPKSEIINLESFKKKTLSSEIKKDKQNGKIKIGRNELCPCGSGKKYKKCCLL